MSSEINGTCRHFISYSGVKLPLKLVSPLDEADMGNRNTFYRGYFDDNERLLMCQKVAYGEVDLEHRYDYYDSGVLRRAEIIEAGDDAVVIEFDEQGVRL
jgi:hypothetical protein